MNMRGCLFVGFLLICWVSANPSHKYAMGENLPVWADRVGPFNNPQEFYMYYRLPFCRPEKLSGRMEGLGESLLGYELRKTLLSISFGVPTRLGIVCDKTLTSEEVSIFTHAIQRQYWYQMYIDNLPVWGMVGESVESGGQTQHFIYTHLHFDISKNNDHIIQVNMTSEGATLIEPGATLSFTYSVSWEESTTPVIHRFERYLDRQFFEHQIHWFSLFNAMMLVVFLLGLVGMILLRTIRKEYVPLGEEDPEDDISDESGWKLIHRDVFRTPSRLGFFCGLVGSGYQLGIALFIVLGLGMFGSQYYEGRGSFLTSVITWYLLSALVGAYSTGGMFVQYNGSTWIKTAFLQSIVLPVLLSPPVIFFSLVARSYGAESFVPLLSVITLTGMWCILGFPLTIVGTLLGRNWNSRSPFPTRVNQIARSIPTKMWYQQSWFTSMVSGLLPFSVIFIETYFVFTALWHYKFYYMYGFGLAVYATFLLVTMCTSVISTYFLLNNEDYRWHWHSFFSGASVGVYLFAYALHYFQYRTAMTGFLQFAEYVGYSFVISVSVGALAGAAGFYASSKFVNIIYRGLKVE